MANVAIQGDERGTYSRARTSYVEDPTGTRLNSLLGCQALTAQS